MKLPAHPCDRAGKHRYDEDGFLVVEHLSLEID